ncbi:type 1 fimbrial protein [Acinetobacter venetianus]|uniref:type 1 fimbrial protein n=1 Tax=Acinetobacter TaxID=469 RepID=UPI0003B84711|nr:MULTISPECIES: type 1 fimbrial protein [Acinetobacter]ERS01334.1 hypothetical protein Q674_12895 [Acinetobacter sp. COS3]KXO87207.1 hypothetical protein AYK86_00745 [Acinetobacter venetianus]MCR4531641.1 type 1 fimbrial protein [Acinetobacter venetianus]QNH52470.1 type 1 fimbrial protein [Acinetobacter venetianus]
MHKNLYKFILLSSLMAIASVSYSSGTIQINGNIVEDTCSTIHSDKDCQVINTIKQNIESKSVSLEDLRNSPQNNNVTEISIEKIPEHNSAVIIASYY